MGRWTQGARKVRASMDSAGAVLTDEQAIASPDIYPLWAAGAALAADERLRYGDKLYRVLQAHTAQEGWEPDKAPALFVEVAPPGQYRQIKENPLSTEAFALDEIGWWQTEGNLYRSLLAANVYTPVSYPAGWEAVA